MFDDLRKQLSVIKELFRTGFFAGLAAGNSKDYKDGVHFVQATVRAKAEELTGDPSGDVRTVRRRKEKQERKESKKLNKTQNLKQELV